MTSVYLDVIYTNRKGVTVHCRGGIFRTMSAIINCWENRTFTQKYFSKQIAIPSPQLKLRSQIADFACASD
jgi:hypothetical protein